MKRALFILTVLTLAALSAAVALWWKTDRASRSFYTDGRQISQRVDDAFVREILWQPANLLGMVDDVDADESQPHISLDGSTLLLVRRRAGGNADIYAAQRDASSPSGWSVPQPLIDINTDYDECAPTLSPDGRTLLFASNRPGGIGGFDLWLSHRGDFGWSVPINLGSEINSEYDEHCPAIEPDGSIVLFASDRPAAGEAPSRVRAAAGDDNLYGALIKPDGFEAAAPLSALNSPFNDSAPAFSPAGDFLYFCSDRPGGLGGFDLYRSRRLEGVQLAPEALGGDINSSANDKDPAPDHGGFALAFSSDRPRTTRSIDSTLATDANQSPKTRIHNSVYDLYRSESREVFVRIGPRKPMDLAGLWAWLSPLLLWLLLLLSAVALLAVSWKGVRSKNLSLLARCLLASVVAHLILMTLLTFWQVTTTIAQMVERGSATRIVLSASAPTGGGLAGQLRGGVSGDVSIAPRETAAAYKAERIEQSPGAAAEVVRLSMNQTAAGHDDASRMDAAARESTHDAITSPQTNMEAMAAISLQQNYPVPSPQDAHRDASVEATTHAKGADAPPSDRTASAATPIVQSSVGAAVIAPTDSPVASAEPVRVAANASEAQTSTPMQSTPLPSSGAVMTVEDMRAAPMDIAQPNDAEALRAAGGERRDPARPSSEQAHAGRVSSEVVRPAAATSAKANTVSVAPQPAVGTNAETSMVASTGAPRESSAPFAGPSARAAAGGSATTDIDESGATIDSQLALPVDVAATGAGHGPENSAHVSASDADGSRTNRAATVSASAIPILGDGDGESVQSSIQDLAGAATESLEIGDVRSVSDSSGEPTTSNVSAAAPSSAVLLQGVDGSPMLNGSALATPEEEVSGGAIVATTQPSVDGPASALASTASARNDEISSAIGDGSGGAGGLVAIAPGEANDGDDSSVEVISTGANANEANDSPPTITSGVALPGSDAGLGLIDEVGPMRSASANLHLPDAGLSAEGDFNGESSSNSPQAADAGQGARREFSNSASLKGSGDGQAVVLAPVVSGGDSAIDMSAATIGGGSTARDAAHFGNANAAAPSSADALGLGDGIAPPALAMGDLALPGDGVERKRGGPNADASGLGDAHPRAAAASAGRSTNDDASFGAPSAGSVSVALAPDHLDSGGSGNDAIDASTVGVTGAINDADTISGANAAPVAAALTELDLPEAAPGSDETLRLPSDLVPPNSPYAARNEETRMQTVKKMGGSEATEKAVAMALDWLARHQSADGRWATRDFDADCGKCGGEGKFDTDVATTGLALLCFLGSDHTHVKDGRYKANVERGLAWLLAQQEADGDLRAGETMYSHGIASIAIAESLGMTGDPHLREPARRAIEFIDAARNRNIGGWRYEPRQAGDTSVTGWQVMALMSAKRAGLGSRDDAFAAASSWMVSVSMPDRPGRYAYQPGQPASPSMSAEGMFVQQLLGMPREDERMRGSADYILENLPRWDSAANTYYWYYATLAMFQYQGDAWTKWNDELTRVLLRNQRTSGEASGSWDPQDNWSKIGGRVYQTAICTLCLESYYRYLPMYKTPDAAAAHGMVAGVVTDAQTGQPLAGALVRLDMSSGAGALVAATDNSGRYALAVPHLPADFVALSASLDGYAPQTENISRAEAELASVTRNFALAPKRADVIVLEADPDVHHLGNNEFEGAINSQFQKQAEGTEYRAEFTLGPEHLPPNTRQAEFVAKVKGAQAQNSIFINDQRLAMRLNGSPRDGSFGEFRVVIPLELLRVGVNTVGIRSSASSGDLDDFEFVNVQIQFDAPEPDS